MRRASPGLEILAFAVLTFGIGWPLLARAAQGDDPQLLSGIAMCVPGAVGLLLAWITRREGPGAARVGVGSVLAWPVAFVAPPLVVAAVAWVAARFGALEVHRDFRIALPYAGEASGARALGKCAVFIIILHGCYVLPAVVEDRAARLRPLSRGLVRLVAWSVPMALAHIAGDFGEELGWRGYLLRRWENRPRIAVAISSLAWALFHLPWALDIGRTRGATSATLFLFAIALLGVPMAALYRWGRSVWTCAIAHGAFDFWGALVLGSALDPSPPSYGHVAGAWANLYGLAVFSVLAALTWRSATRGVPASSLLPRFEQ